MEKSKLDEDKEGKAGLYTVTLRWHDDLAPSFILQPMRIMLVVMIQAEDIIMSITNEQQQALDDALVPWEQRLKIGSCNYKLNTTFKPKEPTFQVALDVLSNIPFHQAFLITASVPAIHMQEFWNTASYHKHTIRFKMNKKKDILAFMRELGYSGTIKLLSDVKVDLLPQPWRTFATIINKCLSGKVTGIDTLSLSRAQVLWGLYHQENVDFVYLLWEDLVYQIENKESRKNKFIPQHEVVQKYGAILPDYLITPAMKESEAFKTYYAFAIGKATPKPKYVRRTSKDKIKQAPKASTGKRLKAAAKGAMSGKKWQPARGLETLSETHSSHASGSGAHEGTGVTPGVPDVPTYESDDEEISWETSSDDDDDNEGDDDAANDDHDDADNDSERTESDNEGDEFVHPSEYTEEEEVNAEHTYEEEDANDLYRDLNVNLEGRDADMTDAPQTTQVIEDTYVTLSPVNPEGHQQSSLVSSGFIYNMLNPNPDIGIDSILNTESTYIIEIPVTSVADTTPSFATTLPPPPFLSFNNELKHHF
ncbi:hypothetical protein Tco_1337772, partial [Tanacetum coccineum]